MILLSFRDKLPRLLIFCLKFHIFLSFFREVFNFNSLAGYSVLVMSPIYGFEGCLDSNTVCCSSKRVRC
jgi:hypothetical protein